MGVQSANAEKKNSFPSVIFFGYREIISWKPIMNALVKFVNGAHSVDGSDWKQDCRKKFLWETPVIKETFEGYCCQWGYRGAKTEKKILFRTSFLFQQRINFWLINF